VSGITVKLRYNVFSGDQKIGML